MSLIEVKDLRIKVGQRDVVTGIDLSLERGEALGIVGESGSGKSLTVRALNRTLPDGIEASGHVSYDGRDLLSLSAKQMRMVRGREIAMIFQDPFTMLNPLMRCGDQITELLRDERGHRLDRKSRKKEAVRRLEEVGIEDAAVAGTYPFELSGGMRQRIGIAAALALDPKVLIADEPSTALDVITQKDILKRLQDLRASRGMGLILITHDLRVAFSACDRVDVLYAGRLLEEAPSAVLSRQPRHPYTVSLLASEPPADHRVEELAAIPGSVPDPVDVAGSCAFAPRCSFSQPACFAGAPDLVQIDSGRATACIRQDELASALDEKTEAARIEGYTGPLDHRVGDAIIRVTGLTKRFGREGAARVTVALDDVSIELAEGENVGLVGQSGSGKTTLGRCLMGLETPSEGSISIGGIEASDRERISPGERRVLRQAVQMVFQDPYSTLNPVRTVGSTLKEALRAGGATGKWRADVDRLLTEVGLDPAYAERKPAALSGGERQRVAIARALSGNPRVLVCDEAVSALDVSVQAQIINLLLSVHRERGIGLVFITHDLAVVRQVTDRIYVLRKGVVVEAGATEKVLDRPEHPYTQELLASVPRSDQGWLAEQSASAEPADATEKQSIGG